MAVMFKSQIEHYSIIPNYQCYPQALCTVYTVFFCISDQRI